MSYPSPCRTIARLLIGGLLLIGIQQTFAQPSSEPLLRVRIATENVLQLSAELEAAGYDVLIESPVDSTLDVVVSDEELEALQDLGLQIIKIDPGQPLQNIIPIDDGRADLKSGYLDLDGINTRMREVAAAFPSIAQVVNLTEAYNAPQTFEGRSLFAIKISDNVDIEEDEAAILIVSNHHAREVVTPVIALDAIDRLTQGYGVDQQITDIVNSSEIWIAPTWNPDGYNHVVVADNLWRKNRRVFPLGTGVDQNRNYPQGWYASCSGSTSPSSNTFKGDTPASEAETQTMIAWSLDQRFTNVIDFHSRGREVVYGYSCLNHPFTNSMRNQAEALSTAASYGGAARPPSADGEHYQWQFAQMGAWSYLIETAQEFQPSFNRAEQEADRVWPGILFALERPISLSGHVTDMQTGDPLEANIEFLNINFSNNESYGSGGPFGRFHASLPTGNYQIRFSAAGYQSEERSITIDSNTTTEVLDIQLQLDATSGNLPPVADAGSDQTVDEGTSVTLAGSSFDPDGTIVAYHWSQVSGPTVDFTGANTTIARFIAPTVAVNTAFVFDLEVTDNLGLTASDQVTIMVRDSASGEGADLVIDKLTFSVRAGVLVRVGKRLEVETEVLNTGSATAGENTLRWVLSTDPVIDINDRHLGNLRKVRELTSGSSRVMKGVYRIPLAVVPGTYYLGAIVDTTNVIAESNEANNTAAVQIIIKPKWVKPLLN